MQHALKEKKKEKKRERKKRKVDSQFVFELHNTINGNLQFGMKALRRHQHEAFYSKISLNHSSRFSQANPAFALSSRVMEALGLLLRVMGALGLCVNGIKH